MGKKLLDLPVEILDSILEKLVKDHKYVQYGFISDLKSMRQQCRVLRELTTPLLFREIVIDTGFEFENVNEFPNFLLSPEGAEYRTHIRKIRVEGTEYFRPGFRWAAIAELVRHLPKLEAFLWKPCMLILPEIVDALHENCPKAQIHIENFTDQLYQYSQDEQETFLNWGQASPAVNLLCQPPKLLHRVRAAGESESQKSELDLASGQLVTVAEGSHGHPYGKVGISCGKVNQRTGMVGREYQVVSASSLERVAFETVSSSQRSLLLYSIKIDAQDTVDLNDPTTDLLSRVWNLLRHAPNLRILHLNIHPIKFLESAVEIYGADKLPPLEELHLTGYKNSLMEANYDTWPTNVDRPATKAEMWDGLMDWSKLKRLAISPPNPRMLDYLADRLPSLEQAAFSPLDHKYSQSENDTLYDVHEVICRFLTKVQALKSIEIIDMEGTTLMIQAFDEINGEAIEKIAILDPAEETPVYEQDTDDDDQEPMDYVQVAPVKAQELDQIRTHCPGLKHLTLALHANSFTEMNHNAILDQLLLIPNLESLVFYVDPWKSPFDSPHTGTYHVAQRIVHYLHSRIYPPVPPTHPSHPTNTATSHAHPYRHIPSPPLVKRFPHLEVCGKWVESLNYHVGPDYVAFEPEIEEKGRGKEVVFVGLTEERRFLGRARVVEDELVVERDVGLVWWRDRWVRADDSRVRGMD